MNDLHEYVVKMSQLDGGYATCFSFADEDNIAMWAMYGMPWEDGVRIRISSSDLKKWVDSIRDNMAGELSDVSMHDICYYRGYMGSRRVLTDCPRFVEQNDVMCDPKCEYCPPKALLWNECENNDTSFVDNNNQYLNEKLIGYVKNSAWAQECETRLTFKKSGNMNQYVDITVPDYILDNMHISIGPRSTLDADGLRDRIAEIYGGNGYHRGNISYSYFHESKFLKQLRRHSDIHTDCFTAFKNSLDA